MHVCMSGKIDMYSCTHTYMCIYIRTYIYIYHIQTSNLWMCMYACVYMYMVVPKSLYVHASMNIHMYITCNATYNIYLYVHVHTCMLTSLHMYIYTYML